jgi:hypothetical protein
MLKIICYLNLHQWSGWISKAIDPYEAMEKTKDACMRIFPFTVMSTKSGRAKGDWQRQGEIAKFVSDHMIAYTNKAERYCQRCGKKEENYPFV